MLAGFPSSIGASPRMEYDVLDEGLDAAFSGLLETGNEKYCLGPIPVVDSQFGASGFASVGLLGGKGGKFEGLGWKRCKSNMKSRREPCHWAG